ncbi:MAG: hypothetical protein R2827_14590 [Bdellovibrionales bacterium]
MQLFLISILAFFLLSMMHNSSFASDKEKAELLYRIAVTEPLEWKAARLRQLQGVYFRLNKTREYQDYLKSESLEPFWGDQYVAKMLKIFIIKEGSEYFFNIHTWENGKAK